MEKALCAGVHNRIDRMASSGAGPKRAKLHPGGGRSPLNRGGGNVRETGKITGAQGARSQLKASSYYSQKGGGNTSEQPERAEHICGERAFQNGECPHADIEGHSQARRLDDVSRDASP